MTDKLPSGTDYYLEFIVPIFDINYIGENEYFQNMWQNNDFFDKLKDYLIDPELHIHLKRFAEFVNWSSLDIDVLSKLDIDYLHQSQWFLEFKCNIDEEENYKFKINLFLLAARIVLQSDLSVKYILCKDAPHFSTKYLDDWKYAIAEKREKRERQELNKFDLDKIVLAYNCLQGFFKVSPRTAHAINFLFLAYTSCYWMESFMLLMTALETLVSPDKIGAIVSDVTKRVVSLIKNKNICSKTRFDKIYELRSDIIHGKVLIDINFDKELPKLQQLQRIVLTVFKILLEKDFKDIYKDENSKEKFYKELCSNKML
ncbi:MAG: HEPN domain-containing protein [Ignavibacteriaceae bacterium]|jgi:hypothetical protein|nr:HEPN domain-containing protein [Ignavibacteriaceae bacterium]